MSAQLNLVARRGDTFVSPAIPLWTDAARTVPLNPAGYTARAHLRRSAHDAATALELSTSNGRIVIEQTTDPARTLISMRLPASVTAALKPSRYEYDLELTVGSTVQTIVSGRFEIVADVTR